MEESNRSNNGTSYISSKTFISAWKSLMLNGSTLCDNSTCTSFYMNNITELSNISEMVIYGSTTIEPVGLQVLPTFSSSVSWFIGVMLSIVIFLTVSGNVLVLLAFIVDRSIRQPSNYFIASLSVTDLLIGVISIPFFTDYVLSGYWHLGNFYCDLWLSVDYTVCLSSQYTVLLITIDRFCSVKVPTSYRAWRTKGKVIFMVSITWIVPTCLFFPTIFGWEHFIGYRDLKQGECAVQFLKDPIFNTSLIICYYWVTLIVLIILYAGIYKIAYDMQKKSAAKQKKMQSMVALSAGAMSGMAGRAAGIGNVTTTTLSGGDSKMCNSLAAPSITQAGSTDSNSSQNAHKSSTTATGTSTANSDEKREVDKERSSSPAFDSDDETTNYSDLKKRPSIANLIMQTGALQLLGNVKVDEKDAKIRKETRESREKLSQISEKSLTDSEIKKHQADSTSSGVVTPREFKNETPSIVGQRLITPPVDFQSTPLVSESPPSYTDSIRSYKAKVVSKTDDALVNMDVSELRYLEESSVIVPSPGFESPPSSMTFATTTEPSSPSIVNQPSTSLLHTALIRAAAEARVKPAMTKIDLEIHVTEYNPGKTELKLTTGYDKVLSINKNSNKMIGTPSRTPSGKQTPTFKQSSTNSKEGFKNYFVKSFGKRFMKKRSQNGGLFSRIGRQKSKSENRAKKAFRTISFILGAFVLCWTPYHVFALIEGYCRTPPCVTHHLYMFSYFLCYANSLINPFCYALANPQFKKTFIRLLKGDFHFT